MKTPLEKQIFFAFGDGIAGRETLQIKSGETPEKFWPMCAVVMSDFLLDLREGDQLPMPWSKIVELGEQIKAKCRRVLTKHAKQN